MEERSPETIEIRSSVHCAGEQLRWRITHGPDCGNSLLHGGNSAGNAEIDEHNAIALFIEHQICRFEVAEDDRRVKAMDIVKHVAGLDGPIDRHPLLDSAS